MKTELFAGNAAELARHVAGAAHAASPAEQDAWARQLAAMLSAQAKPAMLPLQSQTSDHPSEGGGHTGAPMTASAEPQNSDAEGDKRLTLTISTEALGDVDIIIDRADGGVRVVLGVQAQVAESALAPEKMALARALQAVGLTVHSVNVVLQNELGTVRAQPSIAREAPGASKTVEAKSKAALFTEAARTRKRSKRIDVLG